MSNVQMESDEWAKRVRQVRGIHQPGCAQIFSRNLRMGLQRPFPGDGDETWPANPEVGREGAAPSLPRNFTPGGSCSDSIRAS